MPRIGHARLIGQLLVAADYTHHHRPVEATGIDLRPGRLGVANLVLRDQCVRRHGTDNTDALCQMILRYPPDALRAVDQNDEGLLERDRLRVGPSTDQPLRFAQQTKSDHAFHRAGSTQHHREHGADRLLDGDDAQPEQGGDHDQHHTRNDEHLPHSAPTLCVHSPARQLLAAIRADLARSPFHGEGHRKVHARLRILDGIRVARTRVLRVMRAHGLLSPHRGRQGAAKTHDGRVITQAPNVMWGTDGVRVFTLDDGWGWIFAAVEHWNAECVGWHVCKVGSRFAALDPIAQGLERRYGSLDADVARGLALRMDHGRQYLSDHFLKQIRYGGIHPSFGFVEEPETNGVAER